MRRPDTGTSRSFQPACASARVDCDSEKTLPRHRDVSPEISGDTRERNPVVVSEAPETFGGPGSNAYSSPVYCGLNCFCSFCVVLKH